MSIYIFPAGFQLPFAPPPQSDLPPALKRLPMKSQEYMELIDKKSVSKRLVDKLIEQFPDLEQYFRQAPQIIQAFDQSLPVNQRIAILQRVFNSNPLPARYRNVMLSLIQDYANNDIVLTDPEKLNKRKLDQFTSLVGFDLYNLIRDYASAGFSETEIFNLPLMQEAVKTLVKDKGFDLDSVKTFFLEIFANPSETLKNLVVTEITDDERGIEEARVDELPVEPVTKGDATALFQTVGDIDVSDTPAQSSISHVSETPLGQGSEMTSATEDRAEERPTRTTRFLDSSDDELFRLPAASQMRTVDDTYAPRFTEVPRQEASEAHPGKDIQLDPFPQVAGASGASHFFQDLPPLPDSPKAAASSSTSYAEKFLDLHDSMPRFPTVDRPPSPAPIQMKPSEIAKELLKSLSDELSAGVSISNIVADILEYFRKLPPSEQDPVKSQLLKTLELKLFLPKLDEEKKAEIAELITALKGKPSLFDIDPSQIGDNADQITKFTKLLSEVIPASEAQSFTATLKILHTGVEGIKRKIDNLRNLQAKLDRSNPDEDTEWNNIEDQMDEANNEAQKLSADIDQAERKLHQLVQTRSRRKINEIKENVKKNFVRSSRQLKETNERLRKQEEDEKRRQEAKRKEAESRKPLTGKDIEDKTKQIVGSPAQLPKPTKKLVVVRGIADTLKDIDNIAAAGEKRDADDAKDIVKHIIGKKKVSKDAKSLIESISKIDTVASKRRLAAVRSSKVFKDLPDAEKNLVEDAISRVSSTAPKSRQKKKGKAKVQSSSSS